MNLGRGLRKGQIDSRHTATKSFFFWAGLLSLELAAHIAEYDCISPGNLVLFLRTNPKSRLSNVVALDREANIAPCQLCKGEALPRSFRLALSTFRQSRQKR